MFACQSNLYGNHCRRANGPSNNGEYKVMGKDDREAKILRERRISMGLTQEQLAGEAGMDLRAYQRYEYGKVKISKATMKVGLRICAALELDPYEVVFENGKDMAGLE